MPGPRCGIGASAVGFAPSRHLSRDLLVAGALVRPRSTAELSCVMRLCHEARQNVVVHGGLSGLVGGADAAPDELIVSLERMQAIEQIDPIGRTAVVQAGVTIQALKDASALHDGV
jgi:FAD/FMN-containing dehydrogenase